MAGETLLHRWFEEVWNQGNEASIDELMAADAIVHGIVGPDGKEIRGAAAFKPFFHQFRSAFSDIRITIEDCLVDGDKIAVRCMVTATHTGPGLTVARRTSLQVSPVCALYASGTARSPRAGTTSTSCRCTSNLACN